MGLIGVFSHVIGSSKINMVAVKPEMGICYKLVDQKEMKIQLQIPLFSSVGNSIRLMVFIQSKRLSEEHTYDMSRHKHVRPHFGCVCCDVISRLHSSASCCNMVTAVFIGKRAFLDSRYQKNPKPIVTKFCTGNYIGLVNLCANFGSNRLPDYFSAHA